MTGASFSSQKPSELPVEKRRITFCRINTSLFFTTLISNLYHLSFPTLISKDSFLLLTVLRMLNLSKCTYPSAARVVAGLRGAWGRWGALASPPCLLLAREGAETSRAVSKPPTCYGSAWNEDVKKPQEKITPTQKRGKILFRFHQSEVHKVNCFLKVIKAPLKRDGSRKIV